MATNDADIKISKLYNMGPESERMLNAIGIFNKKQLSNSDPVDLYMKMKSRDMNVSINLFYEIHGALNEIHWTRIPDDERANLIYKLDAALQNSKKK